MDLGFSKKIHFMTFLCSEMDRSTELLLFFTAYYPILFYYFNLKVKTEYFFSFWK